MQQRPASCEAKLAAHPIAILCRYSCLATHCSDSMTRRRHCRLQGGGALNLAGPFTLALTSSTGETLTTSITTLTQQWLPNQFASPAAGNISAPGTATEAPAAAPTGAPTSPPPNSDCYDVPTPEFTCEQQKVSKVLHSAKHLLDCFEEGSGYP